MVVQKWAPMLHVVAGAALQPAQWCSCQYGCPPSSSTALWLSGCLAGHVRRPRTATKALHTRQLAHPCSLSLRHNLSSCSTNFPCCGANSPSCGINSHSPLPVGRLAAGPRRSSGLGCCGSGTCTRPCCTGGAQRAQQGAAGCAQGCCMQLCCGTALSMPAGAAPACQ